MDHGLVIYCLCLRAIKQVQYSPNASKRVHSLPTHLSCCFSLSSGFLTMACSNLDAIDNQTSLIASPTPASDCLHVYLHLQPFLVGESLQHDVATEKMKGLGLRPGGSFQERQDPKGQGRLPEEEDSFHVCLPVLSGKPALAHFGFFAFRLCHAACGVHSRLQMESALACLSTIPLSLERI